MQTIDDTDARPESGTAPIAAPEPAPPPPVEDPVRAPDPTIARLSYLAGSAVVALGVAVGLNVKFFSDKPLDVRTDVVGYPVFGGYNYRHYLQMFLLAVAVFPVVLTATYLLFDRVVPRLVARIPSARPVVVAGVAGRIAVPGVAFGLAGAIAVQAMRVGLVACLAAGVAGAAVAVVVGSSLLGLVRPRLPWAQRLSIVNALLTPLTVLTVLVVSAANTVAVVETGEVQGHPFLPWPVAVAATLAVAAVVALGLRRVARGSIDDLRRFEFSTVALVAGSAIVFMLTARVPGALTSFDAFHDGEGLGTATLLRHGYFPWRDVLFIHGPLNDGLWPWLGLSVIDNSRWGVSAMVQMLALPIGFVMFWVLAVWGARRNWAVLAGLVVMLAASNDFFGGLVPFFVSPRWVLLPLVLITLGSALHSGSHPLSAFLGALLVVAFVLSPEFSFAVLSIGLALVGYEIVDGRGRPWLRRFPRTLWCAAGATAATGLFVAWLAANGAVDDFIFYFRTFAPDHALTGAYPLSFADANAPFWFVFVLPFVLAVLTAAFFVWSITRRVNPRPTDWAMGSLALLGILFYPKGLERADMAHLAGSLVFAVPLLVYVAVRILDPGDRRVATLAPGRAPRHIFSVVVLGALMATGVPASMRNVATLPDNFTPEVAYAPTDPLTGYAEPNAVPGSVVPDLRAALAAVGPHTRLYDFANEPALTYYLLGLRSPTRYFHVSMAMHEANQRDLLDELAKDPPETVLYWGDLGLAQWDGIVNPVRHYDVSQWLLEHYRPWVALDHQVLYLRNDIEQPDVGRLAQDVGGEPITGDRLRYELPVCNWGLAPAFLDSADQVEAEGDSLASTPVEQIIAFTGRTGPVAGAPAQVVLAVGPGGHVLGESFVSANPADPDGTVGFSTQVGLVAGERPEDVSFVAVAADGTAVPVGAGPALAPGTHLRYSSGRAAVVAAAPAASVAPVTAEPQNVLVDGARIDRLDLPSGASADNDWLELDAAGTLPAASFTLTPFLDGGPSRAIQFRTTGRPIDRYVVQVASCPQWHATTGTTTYLYSEGAGQVSVSLHRPVAPLVGAAP